MGTNVNSKGLDALTTGRGFVDLSDWWKIGVAGAEARAWLNDLLSADLTVVAPGRSVRSLLLTPTGRIRADVTVIAWGRRRAADNGGGSYLIVQDPRQPASIDRLLEPYVLSADVRIEDRTSDVALVAVPDGEATVDSATVSRPSCVGPGTDVLSDSPKVVAEMRRGLVPASQDALDSWRIIRGIARFPVDLTEKSLPQEAGLDEVIDYDKGCFLGQEAMARVRNRGHPTNVVLAVHADRPVEAGEQVLAEGTGVGIVTSATTVDGVADAIIRVRWSSRDAAFSSGSGASFEARGFATGVF